MVWSEKPTHEITEDEDAKLLMAGVWPTKEERADIGMWI
jgi:hypothetical protein